MLPALAALLSTVSVDATDGEKQDNRSNGMIAIDSDIRQGGEAAYKALSSVGARRDDACCR